MSASPHRNESNNLLDEIYEVQAQARPSMCTVKTILETLSPADQEAMQQAFDTPGVQGTSIAKVLKKRGHQISSHTVQRHRRGSCSCGGVG